MPEGATEKRELQAESSIWATQRPTQSTCKNGILRKGNPASREKKCESGIEAPVQGREEGGDRKGAQTNWCKKKGV